MACQSQSVEILYQALDQVFERVVLIVICSDAEDYGHIAHGRALRVLLSTVIKYPWFCADSLSPFVCKHPFNRQSPRTRPINVAAGRVWICVPFPYSARNVFDKTRIRPYPNRSIIYLTPSLVKSMQYDAQDQQVYNANLTHERVLT